MKHKRCRRCYFHEKCPDFIDNCPYYTPITDEQDVAEYVRDCEMRQEEAETGFDDDDKEKEDDDTQSKAKTCFKKAHRIY